MKNFIKYILLSLVLFITIILEPIDSNAASKCIQLDNGMQNSQYDITSDGNKDTVKVGSEGNNSIYINDIQVFKAETNADCLSVALYPINHKKIYFVIYENYKEISDICGCAMYQYKSGSLQKVCDFYNPIVKNINAMHYNVVVKAVSNDKVTVICNNIFSGTGLLSWRMDYYCKNNSWKPKKNSYKITQTITNGKKLTAAMDINLYKKPNNKTVFFKIKSGDKIVARKLYIKSKNIYVQVATSTGSFGWFKIPEEAAICYFEETIFPG